MVRPTVLSLVLAASLAGAALPLRADDKPSTATPKVDPKEEQRQKDMKKAREEIEKDWKSQKKDPTPALAFFQLLIDQEQLEVKAAYDIYHKVIAKKIPFEAAQQGVSSIYLTCVDKKTQKFDNKKFLTDYGKWINDWQPPKEKPASTPPAPPPPSTTNNK